MTMPQQAGWRIAGFGAGSGDGPLSVRGAPSPSRGIRRSFQDRFAESIFETHPLSGGDLCTLSGQRPRAQAGAWPGPDAGHPLHGAGGFNARQARDRLA